MPVSSRWHVPCPPMVWPQVIPWWPKTLTFTKVIIIRDLSLKLKYMYEFCAQAIWYEWIVAFLVKITS